MLKELIILLKIKLKYKIFFSNKCFCIVFYCLLIVFYLIFYLKLKNYFIFLYKNPNFLDNKIYLKNQK